MTNVVSFVSESFFHQHYIKIQRKKCESFLMCTAYGPPNGQIVFFEELKATLMESLLLGLDLIVLSDSGNGRARMDFCGNDFKRN